NAGPEEIRRVLLERTHSRMPVYGTDLDDIVGYISVKDVINMAWDQRLFVLEDLLRPAYFVPETVKAVDLLRSMRQRRTPFAIVVEERGGVAGIVSIEDLLEELVGEIFSEHDEVPPEAIHRHTDGSAVVMAQTPIRDVNRELDLDLPEDGDWTTLGGLVLALAGHIPSAGERFTTEDGVGLEV